MLNKCWLLTRLTEKYLESYHIQSPCGLVYFEVSYFLIINFTISCSKTAMDFIGRKFNSKILCCTFTVLLKVYGKGVTEKMTIALSHIVIRPGINQWIHCLLKFEMGIILYMFYMSHSQWWSEFGRLFHSLLAQHWAPKCLLWVLCEKNCYWLLKNGLSSTGSVSPSCIAVYP